MALKVQGKTDAAEAILTDMCRQNATVACHQLGQISPNTKAGGLAIIQGATSADSTQLAVLVEKKNHYNYVFYSLLEGKPQVLLAETQTRIDRDFSSWAIDQVTLSGLSVGTEYWLEVADGKGQVVDRRGFKTLAIDGPRVKFAAASCFDDAFTKAQAQMWPELLGRNPDLLLLIGDNVYADRNIGLRKKARPKDLWQRYVETRQTLALFRAQRLVPTMASWDDHDYGDNNGDRHYQHKEASAEVFRAFFPQKATAQGLTKGPGVSQYFKGFGQGFVFLDNRSFRSPNDQPVADETHWGQEQEQWLLKILNESNTPHWVINGDQIWGGYHPFESYEKNHPNSFKTMMMELGQSLSPVVFLTGDRHLTEVMAIKPPEFPYKTFELTTSGMHSRTYPTRWDTETPNRRQIAGRGESLNYMIIESLALDGGLRIDVTAFGPNENPLYSRRLIVRK